MFKSIRNNSTATDEWKTLNLTHGDSPHNVRLPVGPLLVPLSVWQARRVELIHREYEHGWPLGIWLAAGEKAESIAQDIDDFTVIAIEFDNVSQGYAVAQKLRENYGYKNELRAIVQKDEVLHLRETGFDARIVVNHRKNPAEKNNADLFNSNLVRQVKNNLLSGAVAA